MYSTSISTTIVLSQRMHLLHFPIHVFVIMQQVFVSLSECSNFGLVPRFCNYHALLIMCADHEGSPYKSSLVAAFLTWLDSHMISPWNQ